MAMSCRAAISVSSSGLRARVAAGRGIDVLVPAAVVEVIARAGLYRAAST